MFISRKEYDKVNARNVELARSLDKMTDYNKSLLKENKENQNAFKTIVKLAESNNYNHANIILGKIKELADNQI